MFYPSSISSSIWNRKIYVKLWHLTAPLICTYVYVVGGTYTQNTSGGFITAHVCLLQCIFGSLHFVCRAVIGPLFIAFVMMLASTIYIFYLCRYMRMFLCCVCRVCVTQCYPLSSSRDKTIKVIRDQTFVKSSVVAYICKSSTSFLTTTAAVAKYSICAYIFIFYTCWNSLPHNNMWFCTRTKKV